MHIKSIHLDGFKSYQKKTDITGFSPQFNAITGYNGSGKSNVLDSICFILGINKLDNIRAKSMSELISHGGTKATVSIRFDNTDKSKSPYGMEHCHEITVQRTITAQSTGKGCATSYTLNGHAATNTRIQDFFRGIGLNVNNPHFLIMQGRITTVLNMKPEEILGMVEEAAGTKMYDQKKKEAERTMNAKELKLNEIDRIFEASIDPRMEKFREDRKSMVEVTRLTKLKETSQRKLDAYQYWQFKEGAKSDSISLVNVTKEIEDVKEKIEQFRQEVAEKQQTKADLENRRNDSSEHDSLTDRSNKQQMVHVAKENERNKLIDTIDKLKKEEERMKKNTAKDYKALEAKKTELRNTEGVNSNDIETYRSNEEEIGKLRNELESIARGTVANDKGEHVSIETQIQNTKAGISDLDSTIRATNNRQSRNEAKLQTLESEAAKFEADMSKEIKAKKDASVEVQKLRAEMDALNFNVAEFEDLCKLELEHKETVKRMDGNNIKMMNDAWNGRYSMQFTPPPLPGFDSKRDVIGLIVHLMTIKPDCERFGAAIDVAAQGMYTHVVVRTQTIARVLIDCKAFSGRRTMIPVEENKRSGKSVPLACDRFLKDAEIVAKGFGETVYRFLDLIDYPDNVSDTFISAFGHILVVEGLECARLLAYNPKIKTRVLTIRGDDVKPNGQMSGGYNERGTTSILASMLPVHENNAKATASQRKLDAMEPQLEVLRPVADKYNELKEKLTAAENKLNLVESGFNNTKFGLLKKEIDQLLETMEKDKKIIETTSIEMKSLEEKIKEYESKRSGGKDSQDRMKKELTEKLSKAEKTASQQKGKAEKARLAVLALQAAVDDLANTIKSEEAELAEKVQERTRLEASYPAVEEEYKEACREKEELAASLKALKEENRSLITRISQAGKEADMLRKEELKFIKKREDCEKEVIRLQEHEKFNYKSAESMLKKYEWLEEEEAHFNKKGGPYDFDGFSSKKGHEEFKQISEKIEQLERSLCMKNVSNLDTCEAKVIDIKNKRKRLQEDFDMLKKTISVLDKRKVDELIRAHESVNRDFGTIFNCLLPDATAQLIPPEGKTVCDGLEVKVAFNGIQKDSLHELSGGQRSLVALSLILAMLKFKPAPLYILDEVDAALDLSHTANIGMMIKEHFRTHQFIIVSLKQGMFSNADSLFQTSFTDGHSNCKLLTGAALVKAKNDTKLAQQAREMDEAEQNSKKSKKPARKPAQSADDNDDDVAM